MDILISEYYPHILPNVLWNIVNGYLPSGNMEFTKSTYDNTSTYDWRHIRELYDHINDWKHGTYKKYKGVHVLLRDGERAYGEECILISCEYKLGMLHGEYKTWGQNGKLYKKYNYHNNKKHGWCIVYKKGNCFTSIWFDHGVPDFNIKYKLNDTKWLCDSDK